MSTELMRRPPSRATLMTPEIKRRQRPTTVEVLRAAFPQLVIGTASALLVTWVLVACLVAMPWTLLIGVSVAVVAAVILMGFVSVRGEMSPPVRMRHIRNDRWRKARAHADDEKARLPEMHRRYSRYSIQLVPEGKGIAIVAMRHWPDKNPWVDPVNQWTSRSTKAAPDQYGSRSTEYYLRKKIAEPTVDNVREALAEAQHAVEQLENESYANALEQYRIETLATAMQPPPVSPKSLAKLAQHEQEDELERLLGSLDKNESKGEADDVRA